MSWTQVGQELTRWARFLENYHSDTIQGIIDHSGVPKDEIWPEIEQSHGDSSALVPLLGRLVLAGLGAAPLGTLLQCLHVDADAARVLRAAATQPTDVPTLVTRIIQYHKEGVKLPEDLIETVMQKATEAGLPPHKQIGLLALSEKGRLEDSGDLAKVARYTADLLKTEFADAECAQELTEEALMSEDGRQQAFSQLLELADTWGRKKALVDAVGCWPPGRRQGSRGLQGRLLRRLLGSADQREARALAKLLMRRSDLTDEEVKWLTSEVSGEAVVTALWVMLLAKSERDDIAALVVKHRETIEKLEIEDDLIKELLENDLFIKLVPTPLYSAIINYILGSESEQNTGVYTIQWAVSELYKYNFIAEAGQLQLMVIGVPAALRGFSQSVAYCRNWFKK